MSHSMLAGNSSPLGATMTHEGANQLGVDIDELIEQCSNSALAITPVLSGKRDDGPG